MDEAFRAVRDAIGAAESGVSLSGFRPCRQIISGCHVADRPPP
jgi:hypothetical protein